MKSERRNERPRVLIVEDDGALVRGLSDLLRLEGFDVLSARDGVEGLRLAVQEAVDFVLLDLRLPKLDGFEVCRRVRQEGLGMPILILTARAEEADKVLGLELGADDYVTKPFGVAELVARVRALLRRSTDGSARSEPATFEFGDIVVDFERRVVTRSGRKVALTARELDLLRYLITCGGKAVTRDELLREVWGYENPPVTRTVDAHVASLRKKLERHPSKPRHFLGVHSVEYRFEA